MFEQTTPQSNCCLEFLQELYLRRDCLSGRVEQKYVMKGWLGLPETTFSVLF